MNNLDSRLNNFGQNMEGLFRSCKNFPQYKYFTVPVYKYCANKVGPVAATGLSFFAADLVFHQLAPQTIRCLVSLGIPEIPGSEDACDISYNYYLALAWTALAIPVMYAKYKRT
jgi:hypothetical protein